MCRIFIAVTLAFLLLEPAASQSQACLDAIAGIGPACTPPADQCSGDCLAAYGRVITQCSPQVSLYCCIYIRSYSEVAIIVFGVYGSCMSV